MNIFTANQVNQVYVLKENSSIVDLSETNISKNSVLGSIGIGKTSDGKYLYFKHLGAGGVTRSDLIEIANIIDVKATPASKMSRKLKSALVTLNTEALVSSKPIAGQDFVLRIKFQNPVGMSPDNQYWKYGVVHATSSTTASQFYLKMASSIANNMSRDAVDLIKVYVTSGSNNGTKTQVTASTALSSLTGTYTGLLIEEVEQDWILGVKQQKPLVFSVEPTYVTNSDKDDIIWGDVTYSDLTKVTGGVSPSKEVVTSGPSAAGTVVNSKLMADYEYFYMGERADQYRMVGWPDYVPTTYLVDPNNQYGYDTIGIHYSYVGANHSVQKSEKDITIIVPRAAGDNTTAKLPVIGSTTTTVLSNIMSAIGEGEDEEGE